MWCACRKRDLLMMLGGEVAREVWARRWLLLAFFFGALSGWLYPR
jgi:hypothetical protein